MIPRLPRGQRPLSQVEAGGGVYLCDPNGDGRFNDAFINGGDPVAVPDEVVGRCVFRDGTDTPIEDAVTMKLYNGADNGHYVVWSGTAWVFHRTNAEGLNYVHEICVEEVGQTP